MRGSKLTIKIPDNYLSLFNFWRQKGSRHIFRNTRDSYKKLTLEKDRIWRRGGWNSSIISRKCRTFSHYNYEWGWGLGLLATLACQNFIIFLEINEFLFVRLNSDNITIWSHKKNAKIVGKRRFALWHVPQLSVDAYCCYFH